MEPEQTKSKWSVIEPLAVTVPKTSGGHSREKKPAGIHSLSSFKTFRDSVTGKKSDVSLRVISPRCKVKIV